VPRVTFPNHTGSGWLRRCRVLAVSEVKAETRVRRDTKSAPRDMAKQHSALGTGPESQWLSCHGGYCHACVLLTNYNLGAMFDVRKVEQEPTSLVSARASGWETCKRIWLALRPPTAKGSLNSQRTQRSETCLPGLPSTTGFWPTRWSARDQKCDQE
jgi:hypothetical protein